MPRTPFLSVQLRFWADLHSSFVARRTMRQQRNGEAAASATEIFDKRVIRDSSYSFHGATHVFQMLNRFFAVHMFLSIFKALHFDLLFWSARLVCEMMSEFSFISLRVVFMCCCCEAFLLQLLDDFCLTAASTRERATMLSTLTQQQTNQQAIGTVSAT